MKNLMNVFVIALLFFATSCQKEEAFTPPTPLSKIEENIVANPNNPKDEVGKIHNEVLTILMKESRKYDDPRLMDLLEIIKLLKNYCESKDDDCDGATIERMVNHFSELMEADKNISTATIDICEIFPPACDQVPMPYNPFPVDLPTFENPILGADGLENFKKATLQINSIKDFESTVLDDSTLDEGTRNFYLSYSSTYRYSTQFWYTAGNFDMYGVEKLDQIGRPCWSCDIAEADAAGTAVGDMISGNTMGGVYGAVASFFTFLDKLGN